MSIQVREMSGLPEYLNQRMWDVPEMMFRGVADSNYELIPSIGRYKAKDPESHHRFERTILEEFKQRAVRYMSHDPRGEFEWLFLAQHYGIPTRLLDWTSNPLVAMYFACERNPDKECAVYKITMTRWYTNFGESDPFEIENIGGLRPRHTDIRYINQAGVFTIHPDPTKPIDLPNIAKYVFNSKIKDTIRWQLRKMGIHASFIYPSLESIARDVIHEHEGILEGGTIRSSGSLFEL